MKNYSKIISLLGLTLLFSISNSSELKRFAGLGGLYYSTKEQVGFELGLIAKFKKSESALGNVSGVYISNEIGLESNKTQIGVQLAYRNLHSGSFGFGAAITEQNEWDDFSTTHYGLEFKVGTGIAFKFGILDDERKYLEVGIWF